MKRLVVLLLTLVAVGVLGVSAMAAEPEKIWAEVDISDQLIQCGGYPTTSEYTIQLCSENREGAKAALAAGLKDWAESINISQYEIVYDATQIMELYRETINENPGLFYVNTSFTCSIRTDNVVMEIKPTYLSEYTRADAEAYNNKVKEILSGVDKNWTDFEKVLYLHDYLASHARYDTGYTRYNAYNLLVEQRGVCQAYTLAYMELLNGVGIENSTVSSKSLNHIWNLVQIEGEWYHVDVTWDDPTSSAMNDEPDAPDRLGYVGHQNFLLSDAVFMTNDHGANDWTVSGCDSDKYKDWYGASVKTAFVPLDGNWYYINGYKLIQTDAPETKSGTTVKEIEGLWRQWSNSNAWWPEPCYALWSWHGRLVHNTPDNKIVSYDPNTEKTDLLYKPDTTNGCLYGFSLSGDTATCLLAQNPYSLAAWELKTAPLFLYTSVGEGKYSTYEKDGTLHARQDAANGILVLARYDANDRMIQVQTTSTQNGELSADIPESGYLKIFALNANYAPRCAAQTVPAESA